MLVVLTKTDSHVRTTEKDGANIAFIISKRRMRKDGWKTSANCLETKSFGETMLKIAKVSVSLVVWIMSTN